ncbi:MAG: 50S ribosomal protein L28 [Calditrichaeota bacterium]|nr:MAG: 50S ribosomal protein L28 [Calditrichota bacterium]
MSRKCEVCGKGPSVGNNVPIERSNSGVRTKRRWLPNLQSVKVSENGTNKRMKVCTSCISAGKIAKAGKRNLQNV